MFIICNIIIFNLSMICLIRKNKSFKTQHFNVGRKLTFYGTEDIIIFLQINIILSSIVITLNFLFT